MYNKTILPEKLREFSYYKEKLPLYLRQSSTFSEHFRIWYDLLINNSSVVSDSTYLGLWRFNDTVLDEELPIPGEGVEPLLDKSGEILLDKTGEQLFVKRIVDEYSYEVSFISNDIYFNKLTFDFSPILTISYENENETILVYDSSLDAPWVSETYKTIKILSDIVEPIQNISLLSLLNKNAKKIYKGISSIGDALLSLLNIFDKNYLDDINNLYPNPDLDLQDPSYSNVCDILDKIGSIFGLNRKFSVKYYLNSSLVTRLLDLNNKDFLLLIKSQIIKNCCEGTYEQIDKFYKDAGLDIILYTDEDSAATVYMILETSQNQYSDEIDAMFRSGLLTIQSVGVKYDTSIGEVSNILIWAADTSLTNQMKWDSNKWYF